MERMKILSDKKYDSLIIEIETLKEIRENDDMCIDMMADRINRLEEENKNLKEKVETLELWLDNKEKLNEELSKYKKQYEHSMGEDDELIYEEGLYD